MSPTHLQDHHAKMNSNNNNGICPPSLRINKGSHVIKKSSSSSSSSMLSPPCSSSSSSASSLGVAGPNKQLQRHPVIIYTHSPKVIHTHPKDFMALVQKLTGCSRSEDDQAGQIKQEKGNPMPERERERKTETESKGVKGVVGNEDNESSSVITSDENCGSIGDPQVNSCFVPPKFDPPNLYMANIPLFTPNSADFLCPDQPFYNYTDPLLFTPNMRASMSSSSAFEGMNKIRDY